jgi:hypothetical protein
VDFRYQMTIKHMHLLVHILMSTYDTGIPGEVRVEPLPVVQGPQDVGLVGVGGQLQLMRIPISNCCHLHKLNY